jgi:hypothetical protein
MGRTYLGLVGISLAFIISVLPLVSAESTIGVWNTTCVNNIETSLVCNGFCTDSGSVLFNHTQICQNGCNNETNTCDTAYNVPTDFFSLMVVGLLAIAGMFLVIAIKFPDDWGVVKTLFYISAMIVVVADIGVMGSFFLASQNDMSNIVNSVYLAAIFILILFVAYIILRWVLAFAIKFLRDVEAKKRRG